MPRCSTGAYKNGRNMGPLRHLICLQRTRCSQQTGFSTTDSDANHRRRPPGFRMRQTSKCVGICTTTKGRTRRWVEIPSLTSSSLKKREDARCRAAAQPFIQALFIYENGGLNRLHYPFIHLFCVFALPHLCTQEVPLGRNLHLWRRRRKRRGREKICHSDVIHSKCKCGSESSVSQLLAAMATWTNQTQP